MAVEAVVGFHPCRNAEIATKEIRGRAIRGRATAGRAADGRTGFSSHGGYPAASGGASDGGGSDRGGTHRPFDLAGAALAEMHAAGFVPEFAPEVEEEVARIRTELAAGGHDAGVEDLTALGWSSIDNDTSKDLDQIEVADRVAGGIRMRVAIGDVAAVVKKGSAIDEHAAAQTQTIYTAVRNFPMLPLELSTDLTSLNEDGDRQAVMMTFTVAADGSLLDEKVGRALVRNRAQLAYSRVGPWLDKTAAGDKDDAAFDLRSDSAREAQAQSEGMKTGDAAWLVAQLTLQKEATDALHAARVKAGALEFHKAEADPVVIDGKVVGVQEATQNSAMLLIEDLMVAANGVMARALRKGGRSGLQRVVVVPQRWDRIVSLAKDKGYDLPETPDSVALNNVLTQLRAKL